MKEYVREQYDISRFNDLFEGAPGNEDSHYSGFIQPSHYAASNRLIFTLANIIKYVFRYSFKNGKEDLKKALWYTKFQIRDHDIFISPTWVKERIKVEEYNKVNDWFTSLQVEINKKIDLYNRSCNMHLLTEIEEILEEAIENYDA